MKKSIPGLLCFLAVILLFTNCRKKAFDEFYGRPDNLQPPIYQVLQQRGNFTNLLACIDKAGYTSTLSKAGFWTFFAPNDEAFAKYFAEKGIALKDIDAEKARGIVTYGLVYNAFESARLDDYQAPQGWVPDQAFKRRTAYFDGFYTGKGPSGATTALISQNRNAGYVFGDDNNKYIPFFSSAFMTPLNLTAADYNYFFPDVTYTGFNVANSAVTNKDIIAENGVIHEIDQVVEPLKTIEQKLASNSEYSAFRDLFEKYMVQFAQNEQVTRRYSLLTGKSDPVYVKLYSDQLAFSPNNEGFVREFEHDAQTDGYTLFAPADGPFTTYLNNVILEFYDSVDDLPPAIITDLINAHMWETVVWPSKFSTTASFLNEPARFNSAKVSAGGNVIESYFGSNGVFYGTNKVQEANLFSTVYARAYLDPDYSIMTRLLDLNGRIPLISPNLEYTIFMMSDATLNAMGYDYDNAINQFTYTANNATISGAAIQNELLRILNLHILPFKQKDLSGSGIGETGQGEYIRWDNNKIYSAGTIEKNWVLTVDPNRSRDYVNGTVHFVTSASNGGNAMLTPPANTVARSIQLNAGTTANKGPYYWFWEYLRQSQAFDPASQEIIGLQLGANYTVFVPTEEAMKKAVVDGYLPGTVSNGNWVSFTTNPGSTQDKDRVKKFIQYHILKDITIAPDGMKSTPTGRPFPTLLRDDNGEVVNVIVFNSPGSLKVADTQGRQAELVAPIPFTGTNYLPQTSNYLGTRVLFHQIDDYLRY